MHSKYKNKKISTFFITALMLVVSACSTLNTTTTPHVSQTTTPKTKQPVITEKKYDLGIIGAVEPVYILPKKIALLARIDTGATTSSIDAKNIKLFERDGVEWVSFDIIERKNKTVHHFEKKLRRKISIKRVNQDENRFVVNMDISFGNKTITEEFTLADREKFKYPVLIGRNILNGRAVVDISVSNTLY